MCYRTQLVLQFTQSDQYWDQRILQEVQAHAHHHHANVFARDQWPVVTAGDPTHISLMQCGLVPVHMKDPVAFLKQYSTYNAKSEEIYEKRTFARAAREGHRCLIPVTGFFEWMHLGKEKYPYFIHKRGGGIFHLGGLYEGDSYCILTTVANSRMAMIHNSKRRMPVIIPDGMERDWLNPALSKEDVLALCRPAPDDYLEDHTVSRLITSRSEDTNVPAVWERHHYAELDPRPDRAPSLFPE